MNQREALKLALEALELEDMACRYEKDQTPEHITKAITAIREALALSESSTKCEETSHAQPEQEPVVWMYQNKSTHEVRFQKHMRSFVDHGAWYEVPLYSEPLANQEKTSGSPKPAKTEALRLADAMEYDLDWCDEAAAELRRMHDLLGKANALCRIRAEEIERLKAQPDVDRRSTESKETFDQQEPVANISIWHKNGEQHAELWNWDKGIEKLPDGEYDLYTTPPHPEPVIDKSAAIRIATSLGWEPKRTWSGLTEEEQQELYDAWMQKDDGCGSFYTLIEAKLKEKNT